MPDERAINKVIYGGNTLMDITDTTATESDVVSGEIFYLANGTRGVGTANYISTETDPTVPSWAKQADPPTYTLTYDQNSSVGSAKVGTAKTGTPNYIPSWSLSATSSVRAIGKIQLTESHSNGVLSIGITSGIVEIPIVDTLNGNGVRFVIERET